MGTCHGGASAVSKTERNKIASGIANHTKEENDRAQKSYERYISNAEKKVNDLDEYIKSGHIKSAKDPWYQDIVKSYKALTAQYNVFKSERKKQGR